MGARDNRSNPRIRVDQIAEVVLRPPTHRRIPATIRTASATGLGLTLSGTDAKAVTRGHTVMVHFELERERMQLPAKVAWRSPDDITADAGVRVHLEIAGATMRDNYDRWIEQLLRSQRS